MIEESTKETLAEMQKSLDENDAKLAKNLKAAEENARMHALLSRVRNDFRAHAVGAEDSKKMADVRSICSTLAVWLCHNVPAGREQATALTKLEECMFHANAGIARNSIEGVKL